MKKYLFSGLLIVSILFISLSVFSSEQRPIDDGKEIELIAEKHRPTKSLPLTPGIKAYKRANSIEITFEKAIIGNVIITVTDYNNEVVYSETEQVNSPESKFIFIDWDENGSYQLEISTRDWYFHGNF